MGSRGRGRGGGRGVSFNIEALGFQRGDTLPIAAIGPIPDYPPLMSVVTPLLENRRLQFIKALKLEQRVAMLNSPYYLKSARGQGGIKRYSDKYNKDKGTTQWQPEWNRIPRELRMNFKKKSLGLSKSKGEIDISHRVNNVDNDEDDEDEDENEENNANKAVAIDEDCEEEDMEEDNDYNLTYFDNGEGDMDDGDDDEGPVY